MKLITDIDISEAEYLAQEAQSLVRDEYVAGQLYPMAENSLRHNVIVGNLLTRLRNHLRGSACRCFGLEIKLRIPQWQSIYYPDVMVTCDSRHQNITASDMLIEAPRLIVEVLSVSTEATDRREKLLAYRSLPSLLEYVLVSQEEARIEIHRRRGDIGWQIITLTPGDPVEFASVELTTDFATVYEESGLAIG